MIDVETLVCVNITRDILTSNLFTEQCLECHERFRHTVPINIEPIYNKMFVFHEHERKKLWNKHC